MVDLSGGSILDIVRIRFVVSGVVQGVGFRPFVFRLARHHRLAGHVFNARDGVWIEAEGPPDAVEAFAAEIPVAAPAHARIDAIDRLDLVPVGEADFAVLESAPDATPALRVPPDLATCPDCLAELLDPQDRRFRYPLINCTACGPRFSILDALPYDRQRTSMRAFALCPDCADEYGKPADRRFHAEPVACSACGPQLRFRNGAGKTLAAEEDALRAAARGIAAGRIMAVKGLGGYHLIADAANDTAVDLLRRRKRRPTKPMAVMVPSLAVARACCVLSAADEGLLQSGTAPIVLAPCRDGAPISALLAPGCRDLGLMLPYTPVHHLLMHALQRPLVVTSGNRSGEPIFHDDRGARRGLRTVAEGFLSHNRPIRRPVDDSVMRTVAGAPQVLRLGRGLAPQVLLLDADVVPDGPTILALGGNMKTAPVLLRGREAILGPHAGDLESLAAEAAYCRAVEDLQALHNCRAEALACDRHPDYPTTHLAETFGLPMVQVQHHAAHIASVVAEHGLKEPVLGFAWDGTGYGLDGTVWGGEGIWMGPEQWHRAVRLRPFPLPGGEQAVREPRRALYGLLHDAGLLDQLPSGLFDEAEQTSLSKLLEVGLNTPCTSSVGRLFDALAALVGLGSVNRHEGEAAIRLEHHAWRGFAGEGPQRYPFGISETGPDGLLEWDLRPTLCAIAADRTAGVPVERIALNAHETLAAMIAAIARSLGAAHVALSGGCFQNRLLTERCLDLLQQDGRRVYLNRQVPPGDGGLALGQALIARRHLAMGG